MITVRQYADKYGISDDEVRALHASGRVRGRLMNGGRLKLQDEPPSVLAHAVPQRAEIIAAAAEAGYEVDAADVRAALAAGTLRLTRPAVQSWIEAGCPCRERTAEDECREARAGAMSPREVVELQDTATKLRAECSRLESTVATLRLELARERSRKEAK